MKTRDAILHVLGKASGPSKYGLAKLLKVQPIMVDHYLNGSRMKQDKADKFEHLFGIKLTDVYDPTKDALERLKNDPEAIPGRGER